MRKTLITAALTAALALPLVAGPTAAEASCQGRKETGMVLGGLGGALLGNSISKGGGGAVIGGLGGAVVGHQIAKSGCGHTTRTAYRSNRSRAASDTRYASSREPVRKVYYDQYGAPIVTTPTTYYAR